MSNIHHIKDLIPDPRNARAHTPRNVGMIEAALGEVGAARSIVIDEDGVVLAGNATIEAAAQAGIEKVQVVDADGNTIIAVRRSGLTPEQKTRLALYDNRAAELADWDAGVLAALAEETDLSQLFRDDELAALLAQEAVDIGGAGDEFDTTPQGGPTRTQVGDLWTIGDKHRLLVGDCTDAANVARLMGGERADICFTSPPYNLGDHIAISNRSQSLKSQGSAYVSTADSMTHAEYLSLLGNVTEIALANADYLLLNVQSLAGNKVALIEWLYAYRDHFADVAIWHKTNQQPAMAERVMNSSFEYIYFLSAEKSPSRAIRTASFRGTFSNVYTSTINVNEFAEIHGAAFPLEFAQTFVDGFSRKSVLDMFMGIGTTLIAAHQTGRRCYGMEISPRYADVILRRAEAAGLSCERDD